MYEYDLTTTTFNFQAGDTLNISWPGDVLQLDQTRFSLAHYNYNGTFPGIPMVSIVVGGCGSETDPLTLNTLYCEEITEPAASDITGTQADTVNKKANSRALSISTSTNQILNFIQMLMNQKPN